MAVASAVLLGVYDAAKKAAVRHNAVPPVLMAAVTIAAMIWAAVLVTQRAGGVSQWPSVLTVSPMTWSMHGLVLVKSVLVGVSWTLAYYALRRLPLSIAGPLRAVGPVWTVALATLVLSERPSATQWVGIAGVLAGFVSLSFVGRREGIRFTRDPAVALMILATVVGACSGLYDKWLLGGGNIDVPTLQCWFSIDLVVVIAPLALHWAWRRRTADPFRWRWSIVAIPLFLLAADFAYFTALTDPAAMVAAVSPVRRLATVVSFAIAVTRFGDANPRPKAVCIAVLLAGVVAIGLG